MSEFYGKILTTKNIILINFRKNLRVKIDFSKNTF